MANADLYYGDDTRHGEYQYVSLDDIIKDMQFEATDDDSYFKNTRRSQFIYHARNGVRELNKSTANEIKAFQISISDSLFIVLPQDYVDYVRVSLVTDDHKLVPLNINRNMSVAEGYLQDSDYNLLFDNDGCVLTADASNVYGKPFTIYEFDDVWTQGGFFTSDMSKFSQYGEFTVDERRGRMAFSSNMQTREVVIEYVSDGIQWETIDQTTIKVHKYLVEALKAWIRWKVVENKRTVPRNYKLDKRAEYKGAKHRAKLERSDINLIEIDKAMRSTTKWV